MINHAIIYRWKRNLVSTNLDIYGDNSIAEDAEIGFLPPGNSSQYEAPISLILQLTA
jgi:hypothetical protein